MAGLISKSLWDESEQTLTDAVVKPLADSLTASLGAYQQQAQQAAQSFHLPHPSEIFGGGQPAQPDATQAPAQQPASFSLPHPSDIFGASPAAAAAPQTPAYQTGRASTTPAQAGIAGMQAPSGAPSAMPTGDMSDEAWARQEARRLGIEEQKAVDVGNTEGGFTQPGIQNRQGAPAYGPYQHYLGGPENPGLGDEALAQGIDPRDPANSKRLITHALEHAAKNGWGAFQGAAAHGIGDWDGIGGTPAIAPTTGDTVTYRDQWGNTYTTPRAQFNARPGGNADVTVVPTPNAPATAATSPPQPSAGAPRPSYSGPYTQQALSDAGDPDAWSKCGPVAAFQAAQILGRTPTPEETERIARQVGWTGTKGMAGLESEANLLRGMNIAAHSTRDFNWQQVIADVQRGNPVILEMPGHEGHYITAQSYDARTGKIDFGSTVGDLASAGHRTQMTPDDLEGIGWGSPSGALFIDNPASPAPSAVAGRAAGLPQLATSGDVQKALGADVPDSGMSAGDQKRAKLAAARGETWNPATVSATDAGMGATGSMSSSTAGPAPADQMYRQPLTPTQGDTATGQEFDPDSGPRESGYTLPAAGSPENVSATTGSLPVAPDGIPPAGLPPLTSYGAAQDDPGSAPGSPYVALPPTAPLASDAGQMQEMPVTQRPGSQYAYQTAGTPLASDQDNLTEMPVRPTPRVVGADQPLQSDQGQMTEMQVARPRASQATAYGASGDDPGTASTPPRIVQAGMPSINLPDLTPVYDAGGKLLSYIHHGAEQIKDGASSLVEGAKGVASAVDSYLPAPAGGLPETGARIRQIQDQAAADQGKSGDVRAMFTAADDPQWRAQNPDLAQEYDDLQGQYTLGVGGSTHEAPEPLRPAPQTVEALQQRVEQANSIVQRLLHSGDPERLAMAQENRAALEADLIDAQNARRGLEPRIRSEVGRTEQSISPSAETVENRMDAVRPLPDRPMAPSDLSGPVSIPTDTGNRLNSGVGASGRPGVLPTLANAAQGGVMGAASEDLQAEQEGRDPDPTQRLLRAAGGAGLAVLAGRAMRGAHGERLGSGVVPEGERPPARTGLGNVPPSKLKEPMFPGMADIPAKRPVPLPESVGDAAAQGEMRAGGSALPGMEGQAADRYLPTREAVPGATVPEAAAARGEMARRGSGYLPEMDDPLRPLHPPDEALRSVQQFPEAKSWVERQTKQNRFEMARNGTETLSPLRWTMRLAGNVSYGSMLGPGTAAFNGLTGAGEALWAVPKEFTRGVARAGQTGNLNALREQGEAQWGALYGLSKLGDTILDIVKGEGKYAAHPDNPLLSQQTANPIARIVAQATEVPGRVWSGLPDAIYGTVHQYAGERQAAAQIATDKGLSGGAWSSEIARLLQDAKAVAGGELPTSNEVQRVVDAGQKYADRMTYRGELGTVGNAARKVATFNNTPVLGNWASPFFTQIWNAGLRQAEKSPLGAVMNTQPHRFDKTYDALVGSAVVLGIGKYAVGGGITGSGPADPKERELLEKDGWQQYSLLVPAPDGSWHYVPNRYFQPFEGALNMAGELHDYTAYQKPDADGRAKLLDAGRRVGQVVRENPYALNGIVSILDAANQGPAATVAENLSRLTPLAATFRTIGTAADTKERTTDRGSKVPLEDEIYQRWQLATGQRQGLPSAQDAFGQEKPNERPGMAALLPRVRRWQDDPVAAVYREAKVMPSEPKSEIRVTSNQGVPPLPLTARERRVWDQKRGDVLLDAGRSISADPDWKNAPIEAKQKVLQRVMDTAAKAADDQMKEMVGDDEITRRIDAEIAKKKAS